MSKEMRQACQTIFSGARFRAKVNEVLLRELGAALAPIVGPALTTALERELPSTFMDGLVDLYAGTDLGRIPKSGGYDERTARDAKVIDALIAGVAIDDVVARFRMSRRQVQRIKARRATTICKVSPL